MTGPYVFRAAGREGSWRFEAAVVGDGRHVLRAIFDEPAGGGLVSDVPIAFGHELIEALVEAGDAAAARAAADTWLCLLGRKHGVNGLEPEHSDAGVARPASQRRPAAAGSAPLSAPAAATPEGAR
ncbi:MAG: hypothetical protein VW405_01335 [Rhodospirillaceae bacterium]